MFVLILSQKKAIFCQCSFKRRKASELGSRSDTEHRLRSPTPTPSPSNWEVWAKPNNSSLIQPDLRAKADRNWLRRAGNRTIVRLRARSEQLLPGTSWAPERTIAEFCEFSGQLPGTYRVTRANNYSIYAQLSKKRTKKNQSVKLWLFPNNPPFYVI